jgi:hypothetical protein
VDTASISNAAFFQGLGFVLALGGISAIVGVTVLALARLWRTVTS